jgi:hypothetical protein
MLKSPVLLESELDAVRGDSALQAQTFSLHYKAGQPNAMKDALAALCKQVGAAGWMILLLDGLAAEHAVGKGQGEWFAWPGLRPAWHWHDPAFLSSLSLAQSPVPTRPSHLLPPPLLPAD